MTDATTAPPLVPPADVDPALWAALDAIDLDTVRRRRGAKWSKHGPDVLAAWVADMDFAAPEPIRRAMTALVDADDYGYPFLGDTNPIGVSTARRMQTRFGWEVDPALVTVTSDVLQGIQAFLQLASSPGDGIAIQTPIYHPFLYATFENDRRLVANPLGEPAAGYPVDLDQFASAIDETTRIILLCNPHNPTGRVLRRDELIAIGELAVEHDLLIINDEIHADLVYPGNEHVPIASLRPEFAERTVTLTSATKTFNIAGLRLAVAIFGSAELQARYQSIHRFLLGGANTPGIRTTLAAWDECDDWLAALVAYLDSNRRHLADFVTEHLPGVAHHAPEATYLAWLDCRELVAERGIENPSAFFLEHAGVALNEGALFGPGGAPYCRLNFATSRQILDTVLDRMANALG